MMFWPKPSPVANDSGYAEARSRLSEALDAWMKAESDPGAPMDTIEALQASRKGQHLYGRDPGD